MSGEAVWIKPDKISEALNALQRDVTGPAQRVTALRYWISATALPTTR